jgi:Na+-transporting methylmalonyl-CoA/oxaloacetate decarboxylase gamma subunit
MILLAVTADTWIVTGLGFGIVLALLFCLVFILQGFGWIMQKATAPKAPKPEKPSPESKPTQENIISAPAKPAPAPSPDDDTAAIAMALYLASCNSKHDAPTGMIAVQARETAWNTKSIGLNNVGF